MRCVFFCRHCYGVVRVVGISRGLESIYVVSETLPGYCGRICGSGLWESLDSW